MGSLYPINLELIEQSCTVVTGINYKVINDRQDLFHRWQAATHFWQQNCYMCLRYCYRLCWLSLNHGHQTAHATPYKHVRITRNEGPIDFGQTQKATNYSTCWLRNKGRRQRTPNSSANLKRRRLFHRHLHVGSSPAAMASFPPCSRAPSQSYLAEVEPVLAQLERIWRKLAMNEFFLLFLLPAKTLHQTALYSGIMPGDRGMDNGVVG